MGLLDDLSMGLGLKERDDDYYERTARTLGRTQGADREATYRQSRAFKGKPKRAGLLSFMGGGSGGGSSSRSDREPSRGFLPTLLGYRDTRDMFDRGGRYASGGAYQGAGGYSMLGNIGHALTGGDFDDLQYAPEVDAIIDKAKGEGAAARLRADDPDMYRMLGQSIVRQNRGRGFAPIQAQATITSTNGAIPDATRNAISSLRPMLRPDNLNVPGATMPTQIGNSGMGMDVPSYNTMPPQIGNSGMGMAAPQPPAIPSPPVQSIQTTAGAPSMGMTLDEYIMSQGAPVNDMTKEQYLPSYLQGYGISY